MKYNHQLLSSIKLTLLFLSTALLISACGGGNSADSVQNEAVTAHLVLAPVTGAECRLYAVSDIENPNDLTGIPVLAQGSSSKGVINFPTINFTGAALIECSGGTYTDEATGLTKQGVDGIRAVVDARPGGEYVISLVTHLAARLSGQNLENALGATGQNAKMADQFGLDGMDITTVVPDDLSRQLSNVENSRYGLVLAALSQLHEDDTSDPTMIRFIDNLLVDFSQDNFDAKGFSKAVSNFVNGDSRAAAVLQSSDDVITEVNRNLGEGDQPVVELETLSITGPEKVFAGDRFALETVLVPANPTNPLIDWESRNPQIATVDAQGVVTALARGQAEIIATARSNGIEARHVLGVLDKDAPIITLLGDNPMTVQGGTAFTDPGATANDNVDGDISANIAVTGNVDTSRLGTYSLKYNVADSSGNAATEVTRTVNVVDTEKPVISLLGDNPQFVNAGDPYQEFGAEARDAFGGNLSGKITISGTVDVKTLDTYTITYNVSDSSGNAADQVERTVHVVDRAPPILELLGDNPLTLVLGETFTDPGAVAKDYVDGDISANIVVTGSVDTQAVGSYTLTYNVSDAAGNAATAVTRIVNVVDTTSPVISLLGDNPLALEVGATFTDPGATASDNADGDISANIVVTGSVDAQAVGSYTLTYNVSDSAGNAATAVTRTVNVVDTTPPVISLQGDNPLTLEVGSTFTDPGATATDNVDGDISANIAVTGAVDTQAVGSYTLRYNVSDAAGNAAAEVIRTVNVVDTTPPVISLQGDNPLTLEVGSTFSDPGATASDNVDGDISANVVVTGSVDAQTVGSYTLIYNVSDSAGNAATAVTRTVNVVDTTPPVISLQGDNPLELTVGAAFTDPGATASDNVDGDISANIAVTGAVDTQAVGSYTLRYNVSDAAGNAAAEVTRTVNVVDTTPPVISLQGDNPLELAVGATFTDPGATATDNVDGDISANIAVTGAVDTQAVGSYTLRYNVSDAAGNAATEVTRTVNVVDTTPPVISLLGDNPLTLEVGSTFTDPGATASDNVDGDISANIEVTGSVDAQKIGSYTLTYNVSDSAGNAATAVTRIVVVNANDRAPVMTSPDNVDVQENTTDVMTLTASDADSPSEAISFSLGGGDAALFAINGDSLSFKTAPDYEAPVCSNNTCAITVTPSDGVNEGAAQTINVNITNLPNISIKDASILEGDSGTTTVNMELTLSGAIDDWAEVKVRVANGTATVGDLDYVAVNTRNFEFNDNTAATLYVPIDVIGDTLFENDETILVFLEKPRRAELDESPNAILTIINDDSPSVSLNDTGVVVGGSGISTVHSDCSGDVVNQQDCSKGRDAQALAGTLSKTGSGHAGFDFTRLDAEGLPWNSGAWHCVQDNTTGLVWEVKTDSGLHGKDHRYSLYNTDANSNGGHAGFPEDDRNINTKGKCFGYDESDSATWCNTEAYIARVNAAGLCGANDWRLPTIKELASLIHADREEPALDTAYFPNTLGDFSYWYRSSTPVPNTDASDTNPQSFMVDFDTGVVASIYDQYGLGVRLVREGEDLRKRTYKVFVDELMPVTKHERCLNCHEFTRFDSEVANRHIQEGRITGRDDHSACINCHTKGSGFADGWRAPFEWHTMLHRNTLPEEGCEMVNRLTNPFHHLAEDALILWAIEQMPDLSEEEWKAIVKKTKGAGNSIACEKPEL